MQIMQIHKVFIDLHLKCWEAEKGIKIFHLLAHYPNYPEEPGLPQGKARSCLCVYEPSSAVSQDVHDGKLKLEVGQDSNWNPPMWDTGISAAA